MGLALSYDQINSGGLRVDWPGINAGSARMESWKLYNQFVQANRRGIMSARGFLTHLSADKRNQLGMQLQASIARPEHRDRFLAALDPSLRFLKPVNSLPFVSASTLNPLYAQALFWKYQFDGNLGSLSTRLTPEALLAVAKEAGSFARVEILASLFDSWNIWQLQPLVARPLLQLCSTQEVAQAISRRPFDEKFNSALRFATLAAWIEKYLPVEKWETVITVFSPRIFSRISAYFNKDSISLAAWIRSSEGEKDRKISAEWRKETLTFVALFWRLPRAAQIDFVERLAKKGIDLGPLVAMISVDNLRTLIEIGNVAGPQGKSAIDKLNLFIPGEQTDNGLEPMFKLPEDLPEELEPAGRKNIEIQRKHYAFDWLEQTPPPLPSHPTPRPKEVSGAAKLPDVLGDRPQVEKHLREYFYQKYGLISEEAQLNQQVDDLDYLELQQWLHPFIAVVRGDELPMRKFLEEYIAAIPDRRDDLGSDPLDFLAAQLNSQNRVKVLLELMSFAVLPMMRFFVHLSAWKKAETYLMLTKKERNVILAQLSLGQRMEMRARALVVLARLELEHVFSFVERKA